MHSRPFFLGVRGTRLQAVLLMAAMAGVLLYSARVLAGPTAVVVVAVVLAVGLLLAPRATPEMLRRFFRAQPVDRARAPELYAELESLAVRAGLARPPALWVVHNPALTAFSVGGPHDSAIGISHRLLHKLSRREVAGILAHEMSHIAAGDMTLLAVANVIGRLVRTLAFLGLLIAFLLVLSGTGAVSMAGLFLVAAAPLCVSLIHLALSRNREFDADRTAAALTGDPLGLASALQRIETDQHTLLRRMLWRAAEVPVLLRTHPPTRDRIARLLGV
jgi:heat shock protein HtpX